MTSTVNKTFVLLTASAILLFMTPIKGTPLGTQQKGCYHKLEQWAASFCQEPCIPSFKKYIKTACEEQQTEEEIIDNCCPDQAPLNKMYF